MKDKYCRICWNTSGWRYPTGEADEAPGSYVADNGYGHEEWLFNYEWLINGYRYGFLQPLNKYRNKYQGQTCSVLLYTVSPKPESKRLIVAKIKELYIPTDEELSTVCEVVTQRGWLEQMREELLSVDANVATLERPIPSEIINVRFRPEDVTRYDPMLLIWGEHKLLQSSRYHPFDWDDDFPPVDGEQEEVDTTDPRRSEHERTRAAQQMTSYEPRHVRLQNRLYEHLCLQYDRSNVRYEHNFVDLEVTNNGKVTLYEIKLESTAKRCIRLALGQLLEYAHHPNRKPQQIERLVVVGDAPLTAEDREYLAILRQEYNLPISYEMFDWESGRLALETT